MVRPAGLACGVWILCQVYAFLTSLKAALSSAVLGPETALMVPGLRREPGSKQQLFFSLGGAGPFSGGSASPLDQPCKPERVFKW